MTQLVPPERESGAEDYREAPGILSLKLSGSMYILI